MLSYPTFHWAVNLNWYQVRRLPKETIFPLPCPAQLHFLHLQVHSSDHVVNWIRQLMQIKTDIFGRFLLAVVNFQIYLLAWLYKVCEGKKKW